MNAYLINIGDELLIGQVVNTNASWMAAELEKNNIHVSRIVTIADDPDDIKRTLDAALPKSDVVLLTGGLGPTKDDMTKNVLNDYFGGKLVIHEETLREVTEFFKRRNLPMLEVNKLQALVPDCCEPLLNKVGTAPGMWFERAGKVIVSMPGVPHEMQWLMTTYVLPKLIKKLGHEAILHKTVLTYGVGESYLAEIITDWENALPQNFKLAYLPAAGMVRLRLSAHGDDMSELQMQMHAQIEALLPLISRYVYGYDNDNFSSAIGKILVERGQTVATAESCTGGLIGRKFVENAGASDYYKGGVISYTEEIKMKILDVKADTLKKFGVVSQQTAEEMAVGCLKHFGTDYAVSTTGISGPTGGSEENPVGTVWIAIADKDGVSAQKYVFGVARLAHQERTANQSLVDLWKRLK